MIYENAILLYLVVGFVISRSMSIDVFSTVAWTVLWPVFGLLLIIGLVINARHR
jgi:hypothetical protein